MNCYKVTVEPHPSGDVFSVTPEGHYYACQDGICYVVAKSMAEVEGYFNTTPNIKSIEKIGVGYCPELYKDCQQKAQV